MLPLTSPLAAFMGCPWNHFYVMRSMVLLDFEGEKLIRWEVVKPIMVEWGTHPSVYPTNPGARPGDPDYIVFQGPTGGVMCFPDPPTCKSVREKGGTVDSVKVGDTTYVRANQVNLWSEPTTSSEKIFLEPGRRLKIIDKRAQWCRVEDDSGIDGWTSCVFLTASEPR
jgi:hypothetical protein